MKENPEDKLEKDSQGIDLPEIKANAAIVDVDGGSSGIVYSASAVAPPVVAQRVIQSPPQALELDGIAANGGAVGAVVLGVWSILGAMLTTWSMINGVIGLVLGLWGLTSKRPRTAWFGIVLCVIGTLMSMAAVSEMISIYWNPGQSDLTP